MSETRRFTAMIYRECGGYVALCPELDVAGGERCALLANHGLTRSAAEAAGVRMPKK